MTTQIKQNGNLFNGVAHKAELDQLQLQSVFIDDHSKSLLTACWAVAVMSAQVRDELLYGLCAVIGFTCFSLGV